MCPVEGFGILGLHQPVSAYPTIYQVTKSVTRLLGADLSARREHTLETIRTRLLTVNFYLEAIRWPAKFLLDHKQKISKLFEVVAEPALLPYRGSKPYLWHGRYYVDIGNRRKRVSVPLCPANQMTKAETKRKLRALIAESGVNTEEHLLQSVRMVRTFAEEGRKPNSPCENDPYNELRSIQTSFGQLISSLSHSTMSATR
jgi:hypothetical protein